MEVVQVLPSFGSEYRKHVRAMSTSDKSLKPLLKKTKKLKVEKWGDSKHEPTALLASEGGRKKVHGGEARLLLLDYQKARTKAGFTRAAAVANQQELRRGALIWTGCVNELALSPCLHRPGFHFEVNARCPSIMLFSESCGCFLFCNFGQSDPYSYDKNLTSERNVESFKETIWYIQTRKQANLLEVKLTNRLGPNWRCGAEWIGGLVTLLDNIFCIFLFDPWNSQIAMTNVIFVM